MMSKERDLLERAVDLLDDYWKGGKTSDRNRKLFYEIKELLAQPEQTKPELNQKSFRGLELSGDSYSQEPVAWSLSSKDSSYTELRKTEPEGTDMYLYTVTPLCTAPPKREPLSEIEIRSGYNANLHMTMKAFNAGVKFAEKAHGIGV
jgi:hypothetical protein